MGKSEINLNKDYFYTSKGKVKRIPIIWNGDGTPTMAALSHESLESQPFTSETARFRVSEEAKATDDWGNELNIQDFVSDSVLVNDMRLEKKLDNAVKTAFPGNLNWPEADVEWVTDENGNLQVSNYSKYDEIAHSVSKCLYPWKYNWDGILNVVPFKENVSDDENTSSFTMTAVDGATLLADGVTQFEPAARKWTNGAVFEIVVDQYNPGKPDYRIRDCKISSVNGLYKMVDKTAEGLGRRWYCSSCDKYIFYNTTNKRWEISSIHNDENWGENIQTVCYQYESPLATSWLYNVSDAPPANWNGDLAFGADYDSFTLALKNDTHNCNGVYEESPLGFRHELYVRQYNFSQNISLNDESIIRCKKVWDDNNLSLSVDYTCDRKAVFSRENNGCRLSINKPVTIISEYLSGPINFVENVADLQSVLRDHEIGVLPTSDTFEITGTGNVMLDGNYKAMNLATLAGSGDAEVTIAGNSYVKNSSTTVKLFFGNAETNLNGEQEKYFVVYVSSESTDISWNTDSSYQAGLAELELLHPDDTSAEYKQALADLDEEVGKVRRQVYVFSKKNDGFNQAVTLNNSSHFGLKFPYYGAVMMQAASKTQDPWDATWLLAGMDIVHGLSSTASIAETGDGNLRISGISVVEYGKNINLYGSWGNSGNGVSVSNISLNEIQVSGYSDADVNGLYTLFQENVYIKNGAAQSYAVRYDENDAMYHLVSTLDGIYVLDNVLKENEYRSWTCDCNTFSNVVLFSRSKDAWVLRTTTERVFDYTTSGGNSPDFPYEGGEYSSTSPYEGDETVWNSVNDGIRTYVRYNRDKGCWVVEDEYGNVISASMAVPSYWQKGSSNLPITAVFNSIQEDGVEVFQPESGVNIRHDGDIYSTGLYILEDFKPGLSEYSFIYDPEQNGTETSEGKIKVCYLVYDFANLLWKLTEKLNVSGDYVLDNTTLSEAVNQRRWSKGTSFSIAWENNAWRIFDSQGKDYFYSTLASGAETSPEENLWSGSCEVVKTEEQLLTISGSGTGDGLYRLVENAEENGKQVWRSGTLSEEEEASEQEWIDGDNWLLYFSGEKDGGQVERWEIHYIESAVNGTYVLDNTGEFKQWKMETENRKYWISFDNYTWRLSRRNSDNTFDKEMAASEPYFLQSCQAGSDSYWVSGCSMEVDENTIVLNGRSDLAAGTYILQPHEDQENPLNWRWKFENNSRTYTIQFDYNSMTWVLVEEDWTSCGTYQVTEETRNSQYKEYEKIVDSTLRYTVFQPEDAYLVQDDGDNSLVILNNETWYKLLLLDTGFNYYDFDEPTTEETDTLTAESMIDANSTVWKLENGWLLKSSKEDQATDGIIAFQLFAGDMPYSERTPSNTLPSWSMGEVKNPFENARLFDVLVPFDLSDEQFYGYVVKFSNTELRFEIHDEIPGGSRTWRAEDDTGAYILKRSENYYWAVYSENSQHEEYYDTPYYARIYAQGAADVKDLSELSWNSNFSFDTISVERITPEATGVRTYHMKVGYRQDNALYSSNEVTFQMEMADNNIAVGKTTITGSSGSIGYTGFYVDANGRFIHTSLVTLSMYASSPLEIRVKIDGGLNVPGLNFQTPYTKTEASKFTGSLSGVTLGGSDKQFDITVTVQDIAGNVETSECSIIFIGRLWRLEGSNIKEDTSSYRTKVFDMKTNYYLTEIAKTSPITGESNRGWNDIFYPESHGYPVNADGTPDVKNMLRISQSSIDERGVSGPTSEETRNYDRLQLSSDGTSLASDYDGRTITSGWTNAKQYNPLESSSPSSMKFWVIDNTGYTGLKLEFEYFDLSTDISTSQPNGLSPHQGDVLVVYDASQEGSVISSEDMSGKKIWRIADSTKLVKLGAVGGSGMSGVSTIATKDGSQFDITLTASGFETSVFTAVSRLCLVLYTDSAYEASGFKLKAGPRRDATVDNYTLVRDTGELWVHQRTEAGLWKSPARAATTHQYTDSVATTDYEHGTLCLSNRGDSVVTGNFAYFTYLWKDGNMTPPKPNFLRDGELELRNFILTNDDCVDYYETALSALPVGISPDFNSIYDYADLNRNFGKICEFFTVNKDEGTISFARRPPLGRIMANYTFHTFYRLTSDGSGDLNFYANAIVPSNDYSATGLKDWTYVDVMIVNEGGNALSNGVMKFTARGSVGSSGTSQVIKSVIDENRPWDIQSGTVAETVNRTGASFSQTFAGLAAPTRRNAITAIGDTSGGVSFGQALLPKGKAYARIFWCLCTNDSNPSYISTTRGQKLWSSELSGNYFVVTI